MSFESRSLSRRIGALSLLMIVFTILAAIPTVVEADGNNVPPHMVADTVESDTLMGSPGGDPEGDDLDIITTILETLLLIP